MALMACAVAALSGCGTDSPARNWNFERGDLRGWRTLSFGSGAWYVYADGTRAPDASDTDRHIPFRVPPPPEGKFAAVVDMGAPGTRILHRTLKLGHRSRLRLTLYYETAVEFFSTPSLNFASAEPNNQFRVDLMDAAAPVTSMADEHILATIFRTSAGDRRSQRPHDITYDLSRWSGHSVRIRFAQVDNRGPLRVGVDNVRIEPIASPS